MKQRNRIQAFLICFMIAACALASACDALAVIPAGALATVAPTAAPTAAAPMDTQPSTPAATPAPTPVPEATPSPAATAEPEPTATPAPQAQDVSFVFAGDLMFQSPFVRSAWDGTTYDFTSVLQNVQPALSQADFAVANLESPVGDPKQSKTDTSRYAAPSEALDALKAAGFDVLTTANNHIMDQGAQGLSNTMDAIRAAGMQTTGSYRDASEQAQVLMLEQNGLKVAILAYGRTPRLYTRFDPGMGTNKLDIPAMEEGVRQAKAAGADAVILCLHFGNEYAFSTTATQRQIVDAMRQAGATAVIGAHPHVLQNMEVDPDGKFMAAYSLGNLVTSSYSDKREFSALLQLTLHKDGATGAVTIGKLSYIPTWTRMLRDADGKVRMHIYDARLALQACQDGTDPAITHRFLGELTRGNDFITKTLGPEYLDPLPN